jgi:molybdate/tungstate transport system ATP-binding protein
MAQLLEITDVLDQSAGTLSGGERRRVEVARALAAEPRVLLLDEPTSGLDVPIKERLRDQLRAVLAERNIPVLYVTHDQREAAAVADRVAVLENGTLHQVAPPTTIFSRPATPFVARFTGNANLLPARVLSSNPHPRVEWSGHAIRVASHAFEAGTAVWLCIRPGQVMLAAGQETADGTVLPAMLRDSIYEGDTYALTLEIETADGTARLQMRMLASAFQQRGLRPSAAVQVYLDASAVHLMPQAARPLPVEEGPEQRG